MILKCAFFVLTLGKQHYASSVASFSMFASKGTAQDEAAPATPEPLKRTRAGYLSEACETISLQ